MDLTARTLANSKTTPLNAISEPLSTRDPIRTREVGWTIIALFIGVATGLSLLLFKFRRAGPLGHLLAGPEWKENLFFFATLMPPRPSSKVRWAGSIS